MNVMNKFKLKIINIISFIIIIVIEFSFIIYNNKYKNENNYKVNNYIYKIRKLKLKYSKNKFLNNFIKNISVISYDYTNLINVNNINIHICINLNNEFIYPTLVSMESALKNSNKNRTTIVYHVLCSGDLKIYNIKKIRYLLKSYPSNLEIIFYNMSNIFIQFKKQLHSQVTYFRLLTPLFIPIKKIIYLDSDALILKDLMEMYQTPFNNNYVLGYLDVISYAIDYLGIKSDKYINCGVLLINLEKLRKDNKIIDILNMTLNHPKLIHHDQTVINYILYPNIGILPFKYGIFNYQSQLDIKEKYINNIRQKINIKELIKAFEDPSIIHLVLCSPKAWFPFSKYTETFTMCKIKNNCNCTRYYFMWHNYAKNLPFYDEIIRFINIKK